MTTYTVWVQAGDMTRVTLTRTEDEEAASQLVGQLVAAAAGVTLSVGCDITDEEPPAGRQAHQKQDDAAKGQPQQTHQKPAEGEAGQNRASGRHRP